MKIAVYAIALNEEKFIERFCESAADADLILIADTGSTDRTVELAKQFPNVVVHDIRVKPWRFDIPRNTAMALIPADMEVCFSLDIDEVLQPGWRQEVERVWIPGETNHLRYKFDWGAGIAFFYEKVHGRDGFRWHHPCHEIVVPDGRIPEVWAQTDMLLVVHKPDPTKSRGQYLDLLEMSVREDAHDPRNAFYYARELSFHRRWEDSIAACEKYLAMPNANWPNERCYAMRVASRCAAELGQLGEAFKWARKGCAEAPDTREPWCEVAMLCYRHGYWAECFGAAMTALGITQREWVYTVDPAVWGSQPHDLASISAWHLGLMSVAREQARLAVEKEPDNERLQTNLKLVLEAAG